MYLKDEGIEGEADDEEEEGEEGHREGEVGGYRIALGFPVHWNPHCSGSRNARLAMVRTTYFVALELNGMIMKWD